MEKLTEGPSSAARRSMDLPEQGSCCIHSACSDGAKSRIVVIESAYQRGFTGLQLIGPSTEVSRSGLERAKSALQTAGVELPVRRVLVSIRPAELRKDGGQLDLALALSIALLVSDGGAGRSAASYLFAAELGLDGRLLPVRHMVSFALEALGHGLSGIVVAKEQAQELTCLARLGQGQRDLKVLGFSSFREVLAWARGQQAPLQLQQGPRAPKLHEVRPNYDDMLLSTDQRLLAEAIAVGRHNLLLSGSPGCGKSMFAERLRSIMPALPLALQLSLLQVHSACAQRLAAELLAGRPPFRAPHHQSSAAAVLGTPEFPGEISLAHGGVLFMDELPEFRRDVLEGLREPLESGLLRSSRARHKAVWPALVTLLAACNLCPCGWYASERRACVCRIAAIQAYRRRLSGPLLDRIDLQVHFPEAPRDSKSLLQRWAEQSEGESGQTQRMRERVAAGQRFAAPRLAALGLHFNAQLGAQQLQEASGLKAAAFAELLSQELPAQISQRSAIRALRVARSLADLDQRAAIQREDLRQATAWQAEAAAQQRGDAAIGLA